MANPAMIPMKNPNGVNRKTTAVAAPRATAIPMAFIVIARCRASNSGAGAAQLGHFTPTGVSTMHRGQMGVPQSGQVTLVSLP